MNINPKTGKIWINNYLNMYGTLFSNQTHKYIQLDRYYDLIGRMEGRSKAAYAMLLHSHIAQVSCNRPPGVHSNIFMYIDINTGCISSANEMKEWICRTGWMNCNGSHLLDIASHHVWWVVYKSLLDVGLITARAGVLRAMVPIEGRFLPVPYANVAFLSRVKKDSELKNNIQQALLSVSGKIEDSLKDVSREELISELVKTKTQGLCTSKNSDLVKMIFEEVRSVNPHQWGAHQDNSDKSNKQKVTIDISENDIKGQIEKDAIKREKISESIQKIKDLPVDEMHNFKSSKESLKIREVNKPKAIKKDSLENNLFYADNIAKKDADKIKTIETQEKKEESNAEKKDECFAELIEDESCDLFGLPIEHLNGDSDEEVLCVPDLIDAQEVDDGFWTD